MQNWDITTRGTAKSSKKNPTKVAFVGFSPIRGANVH